MYIGEGKVTALEPFPMESAPSTSTTRKDTSESDEEDPLRMNDVDEITTRGGLRPFPMSSQDFEGFKTSSKPSSNASSSNTKRGSSPHPDEWAAKRRRKTNGCVKRTTNYGYRTELTTVECSKTMNLPICL